MYKKNCVDILTYLMMENVSETCYINFYRCLLINGLS